MPVFFAAAASHADVHPIRHFAAPGGDQEVSWHALFSFVCVVRAVLLLLLCYCCVLSLPLPSLRYEAPSDMRDVCTKRINHPVGPSLLVYPPQIFALFLFYFSWRHANYGGGFDKNTAHDPLCPFSNVSPRKGGGGEETTGSVFYLVLQSAQKQQSGVPTDRMYLLHNV